MAATWAVLGLAVIGIAAWLALSPAPPPPTAKVVLPLPPAPAPPPAASQATAAPPKPGAGTAVAPAAQNAPAPPTAAAPPAESKPVAPPAAAPQPSAQAAARAEAPKPAGSKPATAPAQATPAAAPAKPAQSTPQPAAAEPAKPPPAGPVSLAAAPAPGLTETGKAGPLPRVGSDGRQPWQVYARPFDSTDTRPRIAVVIGSLGISSAATQAAIQQLPGGVTLAFSPYSRNLTQDIPLARAAGHEVLLSLPMEPVDYPTNDPGPYALLTTLTTGQNLDRLDWLLSRCTGYVGVTEFMGTRFVASAGDLRPVLEAVHKRGLLFFDARAEPNGVAHRLALKLGLPTASNDRVIDTEASRAAIDHALATAEADARRDGAVVVTGSPYPVTIERVAAWAHGLADKGFVLAPVSAVAIQSKE